MSKEISKKLSMKKTFFVTQLESLFNTIAQEYQEVISTKDIEISLLQSTINKLELDVKNLVEIKNKLSKGTEIENKRLESLQDEVTKLRLSSDNSYNQNLAEENRELKRKLSEGADSDELQELKDKVKQLQGFISRGANAYSDTLSKQKSEQIIKEISKSIKNNN